MARLHRNALVAAAALLALQLLSTGCSGARTAATAPQKTSGAATTAARPSTTGELTLLHDAEQELRRRCMAAAGFRYWAESAKPMPESREFPYVVDDPAWASQYGYGSTLNARIGRLRAKDPNQVYLRGLSQERRRAAITALNGTRTDSQQLTSRLPSGMVMGHSATGCRAEAWQKLYGDLPGWYAASTLVANLKAHRYERVLADPEFGRAVTKWSTCMRASGHAYRDPSQSKAEFLRDAKTGDLAAETRVAAQEARCALSSGLSAVAVRLDRRHDQALRQEHREAVDRVERLRTNALPRARDVLAP
ncbi:hypothetical protein [Streptomyces sp. NPDC002994]|uniref:hypothetical protein n=1 Tax=Streptomyces sp. NPDC002994 TaxID=3154441 RepID=UPI0033BCECCC